MKKLRNEVIPIGRSPRREVELLRQSEERFRLLAESLVDYAIYMLDAEGRVVSWNAGAERIKGYRAEEILGEHCSRFYPGEDIARNKPQFELNVAASTGRFEDEGWRVRKDGSSFWAHVIITALRDGSGSLRGFGKVTRDLTEHKRASEQIRASDARLEAFMDNSPSIMFIKDLEGRYLHVNRQFTHLFGLQRQGVLSRSDAEILPPEEAAQFQANDARVLAAGAAIEFEEIARYAGTPHVSIVCKFPIFDDAGRITALGGIATDITERKRAEEEIKRLNEDLTRRAAQVDAVNQELDSFTHAVSHDLRAPLRHIEGYTKLMLEELSSAGDVARHLNVAAQSAVTLSNLIGDLLVFSGASRLDPRNCVVDLNKIVEEVRRDLEDDAKSRRIKWKIGRLPAVQGDPALLRTVFANLLSNALKFTRHRNPALIEMDTRAGDDGEVVVRIRDNGAGFDPRFTDKLFGVFQRLHRENEFEGTGIGLATVKRIMESHRGRVWAEGEPDRGASVFVAFKKAA